MLSFQCISPLLSPLRAVSSPPSYQNKSLNMNFIQVSFSVEQALSDIILAELSAGDFDTFEEFDGGIHAYAEEEKFNQTFVDEVSDRYQVTYETKTIPKENWNETWEKNYDPIIVNDQVLVKATFHKGLPPYPIEILVDPKMSFGTGHHATTHQMIKAQLDIDHSAKSVLDLGTGTGILAIMAAKLGATQIEGTDIDEWCIENSRENFALNELSDVKLQMTAAQNFHCSAPFDIVLANINKNVLLDEMHYYADFCKPNGHLLLSGFYEKDIIDISLSAKEYGFVIQSQQIKDDWAQLTFVKSE